MQLCEALAGAFPAVPEYRREAGAALTSLAALLEASGRADEARRLRQEAQRYLSGQAGTGTR